MTTDPVSGEALPSLAESWTSSDDAKTWTFKLRKDVRFHDGTPFTVNDAVQTLRRHSDKDSTSAALGLLEEIEIIEESGGDLVITLKNGNADLPLMLTDYHLQIQNNGGMDDPNSAIGTGPYKLESFEPGIRIKLTLLTSYWPTILPSPQAPGLTIDTASIRLALPLLGRHERIAVAEPENPNPLPQCEMRSPEETRRSVEKDLVTGLTHYRIYEDTGLKVHPQNGLRTQEIRNEDWSIDPNDPLSMRGDIDWTIRLERDGWSVSTKTTTTMRCTNKDWIIAASVTAFEGDREIFAKAFEQRIPRDFM